MLESEFAVLENGMCKGLLECDPRAYVLDWNKLEEDDRVIDFQYRRALEEGGYVCVDGHKEEYDRVCLIVRDRHYNSDILYDPSTSEGMRAIRLTTDLVRRAYNLGRQRQATRAADQLGRLLHGAVL